MKKEFQRTASKSYMIIKDISSGCEDFELKMVLNNQIPGILSMQTMLNGTENEYWYDITGMQPLDRRLQISLLGESDIRTFLKCLFQLKVTLDEYMLDDSDIVYDREFIYFDRVSDRMLFSFVPGHRQENEDGIAGLLEQLISMVDHKDAAAVKMAYEVYDNFEKNGFVADDIKAAIEEESTKREREIPDISERLDRTADDAFKAWDNPAKADGWNDTGLSLQPKDAYLSPGELRQKRQSASKTRPKKEKKVKEKPTPKQKSVKKEIKAKDKKPAKTKSSGGLFGRKKDLRVSEPIASSCFEEASFSNLSYENETAVLGRAAGVSDATVCFSDVELSRVWELRYLGDGLERDIALTRFPFVIGTDTRHVSFAMQARTISRVHCSFTMEGDNLYIEDYNSTNGTYINGRLLQLNQPVRLENGDHIVFATEEYELRQKIKSGTL